MCLVSGFIYLLSNDSPTNSDVIEIFLFLCQSGRKVHDKEDLKELGDVQSGLVLAMLMIVHLFFILSVVLAVMLIIVFVSPVAVLCH